MVPRSVAVDYEQALAAILGRSPQMPRGDHAGIKAIPLREIGSHRVRVQEALARVIEVLRG